jgi:hypothetical protein
VCVVCECCVSDEEHEKSTTSRKKCVCVLAKRLLQKKWLMADHFFWSYKALHHEAIYSLRPVACMQ